MVESQKVKEERMRRAAATRPTYEQGSGTGTDPDLGAVNSLPEERKTIRETGTTETTVPDTRSMPERITPGMTGEDRARNRAETEHSGATDKRSTTEKIKDEAHKVKEDVKEAVDKDRPEDERTRAV